MRLPPPPLFLSPEEDASLTGVTDDEEEEEEEEDGVLLDAPPAGGGPSEGGVSSAVAVGAVSSPTCTWRGNIPGKLAGWHRQMTTDVQHCCSTPHCSAASDSHIRQ